MATQRSSPVPHGDRPLGIGHLTHDRLFDVAKRANAAALLLHDAVRAPRVRLARSRKAVKSFAAYSKVISVAKGRPHSAAEHLLLGVAENTLRILSQVFSVWAARSLAHPFSDVEKKAFAVLVEGTGSAKSLSPLPDRDPGKAIEAVTKRIEALGGDVAALVEAAAASSASPGTGTAFEPASDELLKRAGGALSLTEAAKRLNLSRQRVHKRIQDGTVLGMCAPDGTILVPAFQLEADGDGAKVIAGLEQAARPFAETGEGGWAALQWLLDEDPNLGTTPLSAIRAGRLDDVAQAARAYVGLNGG
jgi:hypothetical protein